MANLNMLATLKDIIPHPEWQIPALLLLIVIIIAWVIYRRKTM